MILTNGPIIGLIAGAGVLLIVRGLRPPLRLEPSNHRVVQPQTSKSGDGVWDSASQRILTIRAVSQWVDVLAPDLKLLAISTSEMATKMLVRIVVPAALGVALMLMVPKGLAAGVWFGFFVPAILAWSLVSDIRRKAKQRRQEMVNALGVIIEMLHSALAVLPVEGALNEIIAEGRGWQFEMLEAAVMDANATNTAIGASLRNLGTEVSIPELNEIGQLLDDASSQGVAIAQTLATRAKTLRERQESALVGQINQATERLTLPIALFGLAAVLTIMVIPAALTLKANL